MLPKKAVISTSSIEEAQMLLEFLDKNGAHWFAEGFPCAPMAKYWERFGNKTCYCLTEAGRVGYANIDWFQTHRVYENKREQCWNYCTGYDFIHMCSN